MKKRLKKSYIYHCVFVLVIMLTFIFLIDLSDAHGQPPPCDTCNYDMEIFKTPDIEITLGYPDTTADMPYQGCSEDTIRRSIAFIHGLGGSIAGWAKQVNYTDTAYNTASFGVDYGSSAYEISMATVATEINNDLGTGNANGIDQLYPQRCKESDYVIAHSQGGIAARFLDRQWDVSTSGTYGARKFYGLVTFGTPNGGAHVALTKDQHFGFVQSVLSTVLLHEGTKKIYDLTEDFGFLFANSINQILNGIDTVIKENLSPLMLADVHTNTVEEMRPDNETFLNIDAHNSKLRRVLFYGVEDAPECWRLLDNIVTQSAEDYPLWGAQPDTALIVKMEQIRAEHVIRIIENEKKIASHSSKMNIPVVGIFFSTKPSRNALNTLKIVNEHRQKSVDFLNNANTQWRYLIGSYHRDSFDIYIQTSYKLQWEEKYGIFSRWYNQTRYFNSSSEREDYWNLINTQVHSTRNSNFSEVNDSTVIKQFFPSDGLILTKSQIGWPGTKLDHMDKMEHNSHFQERNSSETKRVLDNLYNGHYDDFFRIKD